MQHLIFKTGALNYSANLLDIENIKLSDRATREILGCPQETASVRSVMAAVVPRQQAAAGSARMVASGGSNLARRALPLGCLTGGSRFCVCDAIHAGRECSHLFGKQLLLTLLRGQLTLKIAGLVCGALRGSLKIFNRLLKRCQRLL